MRVVYDGVNREGAYRLVQSIISLKPRVVETRTAHATTAFHVSSFTRDFFRARKEGGAALPKTTRLKGMTSLTRT